MVILEAWAYGICVVTTPVGGLPDVLEEGKNALVFGFGDWEALADKLTFLIEQNEKRRELYDNSRRFVYGKFSLASINQDLDRIYHTLLS